MKLRIYDPRILALDLRHRKLGYAVYEGHRLLLDWGVRVYPAVGDDEGQLVNKRINALCDLFSPAAVVVKKQRWENARASEHMNSVVNAVTAVARSRSIPIQLVSQGEIDRAFAPFRCASRQEAAEVLARIFPELVWDLPRKRELWQAEHPRMTVFDAVALGLAYWQARQIDTADEAAWPQP